MEYYLAVDIGASSGRHILGSVENGKIKLEEVYRFENGMKEEKGHLCWDTKRLFEEIKNGMKRCKALGKIPVSMGIDTWGVDFVLIDREGSAVSQTVGYRDHRTDGIREKVDCLIGQEELYSRTGIQFQPYNTLNQLAALKEEAPWQLTQADAMLMTPDYFNFLLTGVRKQEYTIATTSQLVNMESGQWDFEVIKRLGLPENIFLPIEKPGTEAGPLKEEIQREVGFSCKVILTASHDTASAVMAVPSLEEDTLYISSGTWSLMGCESERGNSTRESREAGFTNEGGYQNRYRYLKNIMGLWMIQSVRREMAPQQSFDEICRKASKEKILSLVDCNDERFLSPQSMTAAVQEFCRETGQQEPVTISELACVIYNSLARCYGETKEQMESLLNRKFPRIYIIGGGSNAEYLNELTARYAGCQVSAGPAEATALGNLLCQMLKEKCFQNLSEARRCVIDSFEVKIYVQDSVCG